MIIDLILVGLIFYLMFPLLNGYSAIHYGRSFTTWFLIGCVLPGVSFLLLYLMIVWDEKTTPTNRLNRRERAESDELVNDLIENIEETPAPVLPKKKRITKQRS